MSNRVESRRIAPRPVPGVPALEYPSRSASARLANPGPRSSASRPTPRVPLERERAQEQLAAAAVLDEIRRRLRDDDAQPTDLCGGEPEALRASPRPCVARDRRRWHRGCRGARARSLPSRDGHPGPAPGRESISNSLTAARPAEPEAEPAARREAVAERLCDVGDARALILEDEPQAAPCAVVAAPRAGPSRLRRRARRCAPARWPRSRAWSGRPG